MRIRVIAPATTPALAELVRADVAQWVLPGTDVDVVLLERGTPTVESRCDEVDAGPGVLARVAEAVADEVDGIFITCFADPVVRAAREIAPVPVVGGFEPALLTALTFGERVGVITLEAASVAVQREQFRRTGIAHRMGGIAVVDLPVLDLDDDHALLDRMIAAAADLITRDAADVLIPGCTGMAGAAATLSSALEDAGTRRPVVDPTGAAMLWLQSGARMGLTPSRRTYPTPPAKTRV